jgi:hypothetical protein
VTASDICDTSVDLTYKEETIAGTCANSYTLKRTWTATDNCGNSTSKVQNIKVGDSSAPTITGVPADLSVECDAVPAKANPTATDLCDTSVSLTYNEEKIAGTANCEDTYSLKRTWTATDKCGNSTSKVQTITVRDTKAPVIGAVPADATVDCNAVPTPPANITASDNCDKNVTVTFSQNNTAGSCAASGVTIRTWTATDNCGNTSVKTQKLTIKDDS